MLGRKKGVGDWQRSDNRVINADKSEARSRIVQCSTVIGQRDHVRHVLSVGSSLLSRITRRAR